MTVTRTMTSPLVGTGILPANPANPANPADSTPPAQASVALETRPSVAPDTATLGSGPLKKAQTSTLSLGRAPGAAAKDAAAPGVAATGDAAAATGDAAATVPDEASLTVVGSIGAAREANATTKEVIDHLSDARGALRAPVKAADKVADVAEDAVSSTKALKGSAVRGIVAGYDAVTGVTDLASSTIDAFKDPGKAANELVAAIAEDPTAVLKDVRDKVEEIKDLGEAVVDTAKNVHSGGKQIVQNVAEKGLKDGLKTTVQQAGSAVTTQGREAIAAAKNAVTKATGTAAAKEVAEVAVRETAEAGVKAVAKEVAEVAVRETLEAGVKVGAKAGAVAAGKGMARFVPGVNVAMAAIDSAHAVKVCNDPSASGWQKGCACVTAAGSVLAATNIPGASQVGAVISIVSGIAESIDPKAAMSAVKGAASRVAGWFGF